MHEFLINGHMSISGWKPYIGIHWTVHMVQWTGTDMGTGYTIGGMYMGIYWTVHMVQWTGTDTWLHRWDVHGNTLDR